MLTKQLFNQKRFAPNNFYTKNIQKHFTKKNELNQKLFNTRNAFCAANTYLDQKQRLLHQMHFTPTVFLLYYLQYTPEAFTVTAKCRWARQQNAWNILIVMMYLRNSEVAQHFLW